MAHTFPNGICPKANVIAQLEFELAYYDSRSIALTITPRGHLPHKIGDNMRNMTVNSHVGETLKNGCIGKK